MFMTIGFSSAEKDAQCTRIDIIPTSFKCIVYISIRYGEQDTVSASSYLDLGAFTFESPCMPTLRNATTQLLVAWAGPVAPIYYTVVYTDLTHVSRVVVLSTGTWVTKHSTKIPFRFHYPCPPVLCTVIKSQQLSEARGNRTHMALKGYHWANKYVHLLCYRLG